MSSLHINENCCQNHWTFKALYNIGFNSYILGNHKFDYWKLKETRITSLKNYFPATPGVGIPANELSSPSMEERRVASACTKLGPLSSDLELLILIIEESFSLQL